MIELSEGEREVMLAIGSFDDEAYSEDTHVNSLIKKGLIVHTDGRLDITDLGEEWLGANGGDGY